MKAIMKTIKPNTCANIMNLIQSILVIKNKNEATAIQKLIDENGYADIYVGCSKINRKHYHLIESIDTDTGKTEYEIDYYIGSEDYLDYCYEGKVAFKFRCYKVEEIDYTYLVNTRSYFIKSCLTAHHFSKECCLEQWELEQYLKGKVGYAIHISDLEIFDKPKELNEFCGIKQYFVGCESGIDKTPRYARLTKAPQNFCYVEVEE